MPGSAKSSPTPPVFILALASAVFLHVLVLGVLNTVREESREPPETPVMRLNLVDSGRSAAPTQIPATATPKTAASTEQIVTKGASDYRVTAPEPEPVPQRTTEIAPSVAKPQKQTIQTTPKPKIQPQTSTPSTTTSSPTPGVTTAGITAQGEANELTPYEQELMTLIAEAYYNIPGRKYTGAPTTRSVTLELNILGNGALIQTRTLKPSGDPLFDERARQATFRASPFPATPDGNRLRQEVTLKLNPPQG